MKDRIAVSFMINSNNPCSRQAQISEAAPFNYRDKCTFG